MANPLPTGSAVGIMGGGQLGRMIAMEARRLGYRTCVLDPDPRCPAAQVADEHVRGGFGDLDAARALARRVHVATCEFENIPLHTVDAVDAIVPVHPGSAVLRIAQHRITEKETISGFGFPVPQFAALRCRDDLDRALGDMPLPLVMKTATSGYDGKGQAVVHTRTEAADAFAELATQSPALILEEFVDLATELSVICARSVDGEVACYPVAENRHRAGILDVTLVPARVSAAITRRAQELAVGIVQRLSLVGLLAVELFLTRDGRLLVNELAPRPHNSGHYTLDACPTSQFEQLLRVLCQLPLGAVDLHAPAAMANLLGDLWPSDVPMDCSPALAVAGVRLHLYGKAEARAGRKMGHLCGLAPSVEKAWTQVLTARAAVDRQPLGRSDVNPPGGPDHSECGQNGRGAQGR